MDAAIADEHPVAVVLGWGNPGRGDDALGLAAIDLLQRGLDHHPDWPTLRLIAAHQLQVEHALDLEHTGSVLFIDAAIDLPGPYRFSSAYASRRSQWSTHDLDPSDVLQVYEQITGLPCPKAFVLEIGGVDFRFGAPISPLGQSHLVGAVDALERLLTARTQAALFRKLSARTRWGACSDAARSVRSADPRVEQGRRRT